VHRSIIIIVVSLTLYMAMIAAFVITNDDNESTAHEANRLCQPHQGVSQNGIEAGYVICRDGYVAER
jgi:hypothetical protein